MGEYQRNLLKLKAMNQQSKEMKSKQRETLLDHDVITCLKLDIINGLQQEIEHLTQIWEDELNTIAELIRFQIPLQQKNDIKQDDDDQTLHDSTIKKSFFSSLVSKTEI